MIVLCVAPLLHWYVVAPEAVSVAVCPAQIDVLLTVTVGATFTVTVVETGLAAEHPVVVPVTV